MCNQQSLSLVCDNEALRNVLARRLPFLLFHQCGQCTGNIVKFLRIIVKTKRTCKQCSVANGIISQILHNLVLPHYSHTWKQQHRKVYKPMHSHRPCRSWVEIVAFSKAVQPPVGCTKSVRIKVSVRMV